MDNSILSKLFRIGRAGKIIAKDFNVSHLELPINATMQRVLMFIRFNPDCSMGDISKKIGLEKSSFSRLVDNLASMGYVSQRHDVSDRRRVIIGLTERGAALSDNIYQIINKNVEETLSALSSAQVKKLDSALTEAISVIELLEHEST